MLLLTNFHYCFFFAIVRTYFFTKIYWKRKDDALINFLNITNILLEKNIKHNNVINEHTRCPKIYPKKFLNLENTKNKKSADFVLKVTSLDNTI